MPGRYIRDGYLDSDHITMLDAETERFFFRLMLVVDDYGRYTANPVIIRSKTFPANENISVADIRKWLSVCENVGLIVRYEARDCKEYIFILRFGQKPRGKSKFPEPPENNVKQCFPDGKQSSEMFPLNDNDNDNDNSSKIDNIIINNAHVRENNVKQCFPDGKQEISERDVSMIEKIAQAHPRVLNFSSVLMEISKAIDREADKPGFSWNGAAKKILERTEQYRESVAAWPPCEKKYVSSAEKWYREGRYNDDPLVWEKSDSEHPDILRKNPVFGKHERGIGEEWK